MNTQWVFFDLDGTLADSLPGLQASIVEALASEGRSLPVADLRPYIGPGIRTILKKLEPTLSEPELDSMERCFRASYDHSGVRNTDMFDGVRATLEALRSAGLKLFIVTNKPRLATANLMEMHGMVALFEEIVSRNSRDPVYSSKGEMLLDLIGRHGVDSEKALMVGDTAEDMHAALEAGLRFAFVEYGYGEISHDAPCLRLGRISELPTACGVQPLSMQMESR